jgi:hypothetical protein
MIVLYGKKKILLFSEELLIKCPSCESDQWTDVTIIGVYGYIYFVPFFPLYKEINLTCEKCGLKRYNIPFDKSFLPSATEKSKHWRFPLYTYAGVILIVLLIFLLLFRLI